jgi:hypothetical protein
MSAPTTSPDTPDRLPFPPTEWLIDAVLSPLLLHTPGPIPPVDDDDDDDEEDDSKGGGKGGNIDPDDDEDLDDDDDDDDEADKQWASRRDASAGVADSRFVL